MSDTEHMILVIPLHCAGLRVDAALAQLLPGHSRSTIQQWIRQDRVILEGVCPSLKKKVYGAERVEIHMQPDVRLTAFSPQAIQLPVVFEDDDVLVIDKAPGMVIHPAAGNWQGTLLNALLYHEPQLTRLPRAGIVHRLDKDTSGLIVVAKNEAAQISLVQQLQAHSVTREYRAVVWGSIWSNGTVDTLIGRHPRIRTKMAVVTVQGKPARTHYEVLERFAAHTYLRCRLETGRTHQIRVHMQHIGAPLVGDPLYCSSTMMANLPVSATLKSDLRQFSRQALHAAKLEFMHPATRERVVFYSEIPADMKALLEQIRTDSHEQPREDEALWEDEE